jgi:superfamily II DNA or RNA helicase
METTIQVLIDSHLRLSKVQLKRAGISIKKLVEPFEYANPDFWKKQRLGFYTRETPRKISLVVTNDREILIPRGGWERLKKFMFLNRVKLEIVNNMISSTGPLGMIYAEPKEWTLNLDQLTASKMAFNFRQGLIKGSCGSGKTEILLHFISKTKEKTLVIVHTERLLKQWQEKAAERFFVEPKEIGLLYAKVKREKNFTIGLVRTVLNIMKKDKDFVNRWGCIVNDECHHSSATTFSELINNFPARYRIGATATLKRKDAKEVLVYDCFGSKAIQKGKRVSIQPKILFEITDDDLDRFGRIVPVDVIIIPTEFEFDLNLENRLEHEGFERPSKMSAIAAVKKWAKQTSYAGSLNSYGDMLDEMTRDRYRQARILEYLLPQIKNKLPSLLFADRRESCLEMQAWLKRRKINCGRLMGGKNSKEQDKTTAGLNSGELLCAVGTTVGDEGLDIPRLSRGFGCTPTASNPGRLTQQLGRFKRIFEGKTDAKYFYFWDKNVRGLKGHAREVFRSVKQPHRVWYSETPDNIVPLDIKLLKEIERKNE